MDDDLTPPSPRNEGTSFAAELGRTFGGFAMIAVFIAVAGVLLWLFLRSP